LRGAEGRGDGAGEGEDVGMKNGEEEDEGK